MAFLAVLLVLACSVLSVAGHAEPHPLSRINLGNMRTQLDGGVISIKAKLLHGLGETVNVTFSGITHSASDEAAKDWIGVWSPRPADGNFSSVAPTKYKYVTADSTGAGQASIWLINSRHDIVVAYCTGGFLAPVIRAVSETVRFENVALAMQLHLSLTGDATQMKVDWTSAQNATAKPWVRWGTHPRSLNHTVTQVLTDTYTADEMCGAPATTVGYRHPGYFHSATITGLTPNTRYYYQVGDNTPHSESAVEFFYSAPKPDADNVEFVIFGDLGQVEVDGSFEPSEMEGSIQTTTALPLDIEQGVVKLNASAAVFHIGDISYARGYESIWEQFFYQISSMSPHLPWQTIDGNHERDFPGSGSATGGTDSGGECGIAIARRFHMPNRQMDAPPMATWWSLDFGPVHFTVISTELAFNQSSEQYAFVKKDWESVDRSKTPFLLLAGHRPMYIDSTNADPHGGDTSLGGDLIAAFEPLMLKYKVDAAFWGHHHSMQRTCAVHNFTCISPSDGTVHIVTGAAGAGFSTNLQPTQPDWIEYVNASIHGYIIAHVKERKTLTLDFIDAVHRTVLDSVTIENKFMEQAVGEVAVASE